MNNSFPIVRSSMTLPEELLLISKGVIAVSGLKFIHGYFHATAVQFPFIISASIIAMIVGFRSKLREFIWTARLFALAVLISVLIVVVDWDVLLGLQERYWLIRAFQFRRVYTLGPPVFSMLFALSLIMLFSQIQFVEEDSLWLYHCSNCNVFRY